MKLDEIPQSWNKKNDMLSIRTFFTIYHVLGQQLANCQQVFVNCQQ